MAKDMPLVSIIIPVYNGSNYMREAIDSALAQTYPNFEVIVVNDGSRDNGETEKIALSYGDKIRYIHKENGGVSSALNLGIKEMRGEYFSWLSHDDMYKPDKLAVQMKHAANDMVVMCGRYLIDKDAKILGDAREKMRFQEDRSLSHKEALIALMQQGCFNGCTLLIPRGAFEIAGEFDEELRYCQDFLMWIRIFVKGYKLSFIHEKQVLSRVHSNQLTNTRSDLFHSDSIKLSKSVIGDITDISDREHNILFYFAKYNAVYNTPAVVRECISAGKKKDIFSFSDILKLNAYLAYGSIRPLIRRTYYKLFKKMNTK